MRSSVWYYSLVILVVGYCARGNSTVKIPDSLHLCNRDSPDRDDCLRESIQYFLETQSSIGIPEFGFPPLDPYSEKEAKAEYKNNQVYAKIEVKEVILTGLSKAKVDAVRSKLEEDMFELEVDITADSLLITGTYLGEGRYNALTVDAKGDFNCTMFDLVYTWKVTGTPEERNGDTFIRIKSFYMRPDIGNMRIHANGLFPGNKELSDLANEISNNNWKLIYQELLPVAQRNWDKNGKRVGNKLFQKVPYNQLFPSFG